MTIKNLYKILNSRHAKELSVIKSKNSLPWQAEYGLRFKSGNGQNVNEVYRVFTSEEEGKAFIKEYQKNS